MKFVFTDRNDKEVEIITDILDSYNVHYKTITNKVPRGFGYYIMYDIEVDIDPEFYDYLCKEIEPKINSYLSLEECWELPAYKPEIKPKRSYSKKRKIKKDEPAMDSFTSLLNSFFGNPNQESFKKEELLRFEDLDEEVQEFLKSRAPESFLKSKNTLIKKITDENGYSIEIRHIN